jgi:hypothetical protein
MGATAAVCVPTEEPAVEKEMQSQSAVRMWFLEPGSRVAGKSPRTSSLGDAESSLGDAKSLSEHALALSMQRLLTPPMPAPSVVAAAAAAAVAIAGLSAPAHLDATTHTRSSGAMSAPDAAKVCLACDKGRHRCCEHLPTCQQRKRPRASNAEQLEELRVRNRGLEEQLAASRSAAAAAGWEAGWAAGWAARTRHAEQQEELRVRNGALEEQLAALRSAAVVATVAAAAEPGLGAPAHEPSSVGAAGSAAAEAEAEAEAEAAAAIAGLSAASPAGPRRTAYVGPPTLAQSPLQEALVPPALGRLANGVRRHSGPVRDSGGGATTRVCTSTAAAVARQQGESAGPSAPLLRKEGGTRIQSRAPLRETEAARRQRLAVEPETLDSTPPTPSVAVATVAAAAAAEAAAIAGLGTPHAPFIAARGGRGGGGGGGGGAPFPAAHLNATTQPSSINAAGSAAGTAAAAEAAAAEAAVLSGVSAGSSAAETDSAAAVPATPHRPEPPVPFPSPVESGGDSYESDSDLDI